MSVLPILPILLPFGAATIMLLLGPDRLTAQRVLALGSGVGGLFAAAALLAVADDGLITAYLLGNWPAPYGIVMVVDRLAAMMLVLVAVLALGALLMAIGGSDAARLDGKGRHFHVLFQLQLAGLAGAFLTGDLFNLFVFFEILLLASYALLMHGPAPAEEARVRAGLIYVVLNLVVSSLFLLALALTYASLGTLNLADVARLLAVLPAADAALARTAMALMAAVFLLKAAVLPMSLWLPQVYSRAPAAAAALFVILTKVGIVMLLRLAVTGWGGAIATAGLLQPWLPVLALGTIALGTVGAFAATRLAEVAAWLVLVSSGTLLFALGFLTPRGTAALLFYLPQSTLFCAALFLLAGHVAARRGALGDRVTRGPAASGRGWLLPAWGVAAVGLAGLPPLAGFLGKLMMLQAVGSGGWQGPWWTVLLLSSLGVLLVLSRATGPLFWQATEAPLDDLPAQAGVAGVAPQLGLWLLLAAGVAMTVWAAPMSDFAARTAAQLFERQAYQAAVLGDVPVQRERRP